jgi:hypothetical protein
MSFLSSLEQKGLFAITRIVTYVAIAALTVALCVSGYGWVKATTETYKSEMTPERVVADLEAAMKASGAEDGGGGNRLPAIPGLKGIKFGPILTEISKREGVLNTLWSFVEDFEASERQPFFDGLEKAFAQADAKKIDRGEAAKAYQQAFALDRVAKKAFKAEAAAKQTASLWGGAAALALIATFSLVLVLLAIERNTRQQSWSVPVR